MNDLRKEMNTHQKVQAHAANAIKRLDALMKKLVKEKAAQNAK